MEKICSKCGICKHIEKFYKGARYKDGLNPWCKDCISEYNKEYCNINKEVIADQKRTYYQTHKAEILAWRKVYNKKYRQDHKEEVAVYNQTNKEKIAIRQKSYYETHKAGLAVWCKAYRQTEKGKAIQRKAKHKRRALKVGINYENFDPVKVLERDGYRCQLCGRKTRPDYNQYHPLYPNLDHIVPLSKGGEHSRKNTQCLCSQCNLGKHNSGVGDQFRMFG